MKKTTDTAKKKSETTKITTKEKVVPFESLDINDYYQMRAELDKDESYNEEIVMRLENIYDDLKDTVDDPAKIFPPLRTVYCEPLKKEIVVNGHNRAEVYRRKGLTHVFVISSDGTPDQALRLACAADATAATSRTMADRKKAALTYCETYRDDKPEKTKICREVGISRPTLDKWIKELKAGKNESQEQEEEVTDTPKKPLKVKATFALFDERDLNEIEIAVNMIDGLRKGIEKTVKTTSSYYCPSLFSIISFAATFLSENGLEFFEDKLDTDDGKRLYNLVLDCVERAKKPI